MDDRPDNAVGKEVLKLTKKLKDKFEKHLVDPEKGGYVDEINLLRAEIEARGYMVTILAHTDDAGVPKRLQLAVVRDGSTKTVH